MKVQELRDLSKEDLIEKERTLKHELYELRNQKQLGQIENPRRFRIIKKNIARVLTILNEKDKS